MFTAPHNVQMHNAHMHQTAAESPGLKCSALHCRGILHLHCTVPGSFASKAVTLVPQHCSSGVVTLPIILCQPQSLRLDASRIQTDAVTGGPTFTPCAWAKPTVFMLHCHAGPLSPGPSCMQRPQPAHTSRLCSSVGPQAPAEQSQCRRCPGWQGTHCQPCWQAG